MKDGVTAALAASLTLALAVGAPAGEPEREAASGATPEEPAAPSRPGDDSGAVAPALTTAEVSSPPPVEVGYVPPRRGSPIDRANPTIRGGSALPTPLVLAPDHVGLTLHASPSLFWHINALPGTDHRLLFTLVVNDSAEQVTEFEIARSTRPGIQRLRLAPHGIELEPDIVYQWSIALIKDDGYRPDVRVSMGYIRRVTQSKEVAGARSDGATYARAGLWYDALAAFSDAIDASPGEARLHEQRNALLHQGTLAGAVE
jgi:hypothetical protein